MDNRVIMEKIHRIVYLIRRAQDGLLNQEEQTELGEWMQDAANRALYDRLSGDGEKAQELERLGQYDVDGAYRQFRGRTVVMPSRFWRYVRIAACFLLPLTIGLLLISRSGDTNEKALPHMAGGVILPGEKKAVLTLSGGRQVDLTQAMGCTIADGTSEIRIDTAQMVYAAEESTGEVKFNSVYVPRGGEYKMCLSDGTVVYLNSDSRLTYPVIFTKEMREVTLEGEAFFEVVHESIRPFRVKSGNLEVKVLGTKFNVKAYAEEGRMETTLVDGSVQVSAESGKIIMKPGEQVCYMPEKGQMTVLTVDVSLYTSWRDGLFRFKRESLENILMTLARWYDVNVFYQNVKLKDQLFTGDLKRYSTINEHLKMLEMTTDVRFAIQGRAVVVQ